MTCDKCGKRKGKFRCSVIMSKDTPPKDAVFVEDGIAYGMTYYYCKPCLKSDKRNLKVWKD